MPRARRDFSSYWWVMGSLCRGPLPGREVSVLFTRELVSLFCLAWTLPRPVSLASWEKKHTLKMGILGGGGR